MIALERGSIELPTSADKRSSILLIGRKNPTHRATTDGGGGAVTLVGLV
jgi:hypothetical protein